MYRIALLFFATLLLSVGLTSFRPAADDLDNDILAETNRFRKANGLSALTMQDDLNEIARKHSANMASGKTGFGHSGFAKRQQEATKKITSINSFAENVAYGASTAKEVVEIWKNSTGHRRNMLGKYKYIGIGTAKDKKGRIYFTQVFAG